MEMGKAEIGIIPFFGIDVKYQGKDHEPEERFSIGIFKDLVSLANDHSLLDPKTCHLGLFVDPANTSAVKFWGKCGFENHPTKTYRDGHITYQGMYVRFRDVA